MKQRQSIIEPSMALIILVLWLVSCGGETPTTSPPPTEPAVTSLPAETAPAGTPKAEPTEEAEETVPTPAETLAALPSEPTEESTALPPEAGLTAAIVSGDSAGTGKPFTFDATQSQAGDAEIVSYVWNMGDGTTLFGTSIQHAYKEPGFYTVTLTVTDANGNTDTTAKVVEVSDDLVEATPTTPSEFTLAGTSWGLTNAMRGTSVTLVFSETTVSGSAGCNTYSANYTVTQIEAGEYDITVTNISASTQVCTQEIMAQERGYLESLASASRVTIEDDILTLETLSGNLTFSMLPE